MQLIRIKTKDRMLSILRGSRSSLPFGLFFVCIISFNHSTRYYDTEILPSPTSNERNLDYSLAKRQSFGFFQDISEDEWKLHQRIVEEHVNHKFVDQPLTYNPKFEKRKLKYFNSNFAWYQNNYEPNFNCRFERRIGGNGNGDGPKWICDPHRIARLAKQRKQEDAKHPGCVIYSIGSNGDFSFEMGMQESVGVGTCEFHIFDMGDYDGKMPKELERAQYHRWGLGKQNENTGEALEAGKRLYGLKDTIKMLGHDTLDNIDVFKIDCDGCEWKSFGDWLGPDIPNLMQIQVEVHGAPGDTALTFFDGLERAGYVRFHKEPNIQFIKGDAVEYAFLKLDKDFFVESKS